MALFMATTAFGPTIGPVICGYVVMTSWGWRGVFWIGLLLTAPSWIMLVFVTETYGPILLLRRAKRIRKQIGHSNVRAPIELEPRGLVQMVRVVLTRPIRMAVSEAIVAFTCLYLSLIYGIFYIFLQTYDIVYGGVYGLNSGEQGLAFLPIGVGAGIAGLIYLLYEHILNNARARGASWAQKEEMRRLPLACIGGPFIVISLFWSAWASRPSVHWVVPMLSGVAFGIGYLLIFIALLNYLVDAYQSFAASAMAATSMTRSLVGAVLPFATKSLYETLGIAWASSLLGFLSLLMCIIPFGFIVWGDFLRRNSQFCQQLREKEKNDTPKDAGREAGAKSPCRGPVKKIGDEENGDYRPFTYRSWRIRAPSPGFHQHALEALEEAKDEEEGRGASRRRVVSGI